MDILQITGFNVYVRLVAKLPCYDSRPKAECIYQQDTSPSETRGDSDTFCSLPTGEILLLPGAFNIYITTVSRCPSQRNTNLLHVHALLELIYCLRNSPTFCKIKAHYFLASLFLSSQHGMGGNCLLYLSSFSIYHLLFRISCILEQHGDLPPTLSFMSGITRE